MKRGFLNWFYLAVQFVMLAVSIPKVALLFHAYDPQAIGPVIAGIDLRNWLVGLAIDLTAACTSWAAMHKYEATRNRLSLFAPALIILLCTCVSVIANYEDAATLAPAQYANVSIFTQPALFVNPILISAPPVLVLLLIVLVPSVLAQPPIKTAAEIEAEADEQEARIAAEARIREAKAKANARVMGARLKGMVETVSVMVNRPEEVPATPIPDEPAVDDEPPTDGPLPAASAKMTRAMWQALKLPERVVQSGVITPQEVAEVLEISLSHARNLMKEVESGKQTVRGRSGAPYLDLIDALYDRRTKDSYTWARNLESVLGVRKRGRQLQVTPTEELVEEGVE